MRVCSSAVFTVSGEEALMAHADTSIELEYRGDSLMTRETQSAASLSP